MGILPPIDLSLDLRQAMIDEFMIFDKVYVKVPVYDQPGVGEMQTLFIDRLEHNKVGITRILNLYSCIILLYYSF